jgi:hypothetical protein
MNWLTHTILEKEKNQATEMPQWLRAVTALPEDLGLIPSTYMVAHNHSCTSIPGI